MIVTVRVPVVASLLPGVRPVPSLAVGVHGAREAATQTFQF
jgi:hypothetical protein